MKVSNDEMITDRGLFNIPYGWFAWLAGDVGCVVRFCEHFNSSFSPRFSVNCEFFEPEDQVDFFKLSWFVDNKFEESLVENYGAVLCCHLDGEKIDSIHLDEGFHRILSFEVCQFLVNFAPGWENLLSDFSDKLYDEIWRRHGDVDLSGLSYFSDRFHDFDGEHDEN